MIRKLMLAVLLLAATCLMPAAPKTEAAGKVDCSSTCTAEVKRQCALNGGLCGYIVSFGACGCIYP